jgi:hypothetical protein
MSYTAAYGGYYWIQRGLLNGFEWHEADSHAYDMVYLAWSLTEDPFYIETQQAMVAWYTGWNILERESIFPFLPVGTRRSTSYIGETRSYGWGIRNLALAWKMSPVSGPSWLQPRSVFSALSDDYAYVADYFWRTPGNGAEASVHAVFRLLGSGNYFQAFEQAYALFGMGMATFFGLPTTTAPAWSVLLDWFFGMFDGLENGTSGWNRQLPSPHDLNFTMPSQPIDYLNINSFSTWSQFYNGWIAAFPGAKINNDPSPANQQGGSLGNANQMVAACAVAKSVGISAAPVAKTWLDTYINFNWPTYGIAFYAKCGFDGT